MKKKIIILVIIIILIIFMLLYLLTDHSKFYLEDKFYNNGSLKDITLEELNDSINNKENFVLFTYNNYCNLRIPCNDIFEEAAIDNNITIYQIKYEYFKDSMYHKTVSYAPSVLIIKNGKIVSYLDSESDNDLDKYQDSTIFKEWLEEYIYLSK